MTVARLTTHSPHVPLAEAAPIASPPLDPALRAMLDRLRRVAGRQAARPRVDLFQACAMIDHREAHVSDVSAEALMRSLPLSLEKAPRIYRPGCEDVSFDERWLAACLNAARTGDVASLRFLVARRIRPDAQRATRFLLKNIARSLDTV